jgi:hypothetical protein
MVRDLDLGTASGSDYLVGLDDRRDHCMSTFPVNLDRLDQIDRSRGEKDGFNEDG